MSNIIGKTLGGYQIIEQIGKGGMAAIYKAFQPSLERDVAIKVLHPYYSEQDPTFIERFKREARAIAKLRHPNILMVHDFGEEENLAYIVMEYVNAGTFKDQLAEGLPSLGEIYTLISQVSEALDYAHEQGVVHRDVKPSNILMPKRDWALLTDFGLAKMVGGSFMTQSGLTVGTPSYMSPEQGSAGKVDHRTDVYSLGVMLYEMAVGEVPYIAETPMAVVVKHIVDPLPIPRDKNPNIPEELQRIILKSLAKNPDERYQHAGDISKALKKIVKAIPDWNASTVVPVVVDDKETEQVTEQQTEPVTKPADEAPTAPQSTRPAPPKSKKKKKKRRWPFYFAVGGVIGLFALFLALSGLNILTNAIEKRQTQKASEQSALVLSVEDTPILDFIEDLPLDKYDDPMAAGRELLENGQIELAITAFQIALVDNPGQWEEFMGIVHTLRFEKQDVPLAARLLQEAYKVMPPQHAPEAQEFLGWMYMDMERYQQAQETFRSLIQNVPDFEGGYMGLFDSFAAVERPEKAISIIEDMQKQYPDEPVISKVLISIYNKLEDHEQAVAAFQRAVKLNPDDPWIYIEVAYAYQSLGQPEDTEAVINQALDLGSDQAEILERAGVFYQELGDMRRAKELLLEAIDIDPNLSWAYLELARVLVAQGMGDEAHRRLQEAFDRHNEDIWLLLMIGETYIELDDCDNAVRIFRVVLEIDPNFVEAKHGLDACDAAP